MLGLREKEIKTPIIQCFYFFRFNKSQANKKYVSFYHP